LLGQVFKGEKVDLGDGDFTVKKADFEVKLHDTRKLSAIEQVDGATFLFVKALSQAQAQVQEQLGSLNFTLSQDDLVIHLFISHSPPDAKAEERARTNGKSRCFVMGNISMSLD
jgi:hypothetical protein